MLVLKKIRNDKYQARKRFVRDKIFSFTIIFIDNKWIAIIVILMFTIKIDITDFKKGK